MADFPLQRQAWRYYKLLLPLAILPEVFRFIILGAVVPPYLDDIVGITDSIVRLILTSPLFMILFVIIPLSSALVIEFATFFSTTRRLRRGLLPSEPIIGAGELLHVVVIPAYKEPHEVLCRTLDSLAGQSISKERSCILLALEAADKSAPETLEFLRMQYDGCFGNIWSTTHQLEGPEIPGKSANENFAVRWLHQYLLQSGHDPSSVMLTICDADTVFPPLFLEHLEATFHLQADGERFLYDAPLNTWGNFLDRPFNPVVRHYEQTRCLQHTMGLLLGSVPCFSNYSLTLSLAHKINFWTVDNMPEDVHTFNKVEIINRMGLVTVPVFSVLVNDLVGDFKNRYIQAKRHSWGVTEVAWLMSLREHSRVEFRIWAATVSKNLAMEIWSQTSVKLLTFCFPVSWRFFLKIDPLTLYFLIGISSWMYVVQWVVRSLMLWELWYVILRSHPTVRLPTKLTFWFLRIFEFPLELVASHCFSIVPRWLMLIRAFRTPHFRYVTAPKGLSSPGGTPVTKVSQSKVNEILMNRASSPVHEGSSPTRHPNIPGA